MRIDTLKQLREACLVESGNDTKRANKLIATKFKEAMKVKESGKREIDPRNVSFKTLFEALVDTNDIDKNNPREVAEAIASSAFTNITTLVVNAITIEPYEQRMNEVMQLVTQGEAVFTDPEPVIGMTALGGVRRRLETEAYDETDFEEKRVTISKRDFGRIIFLTMEDIYNDRLGMIQDRANTIGEDGSQHQEQMIIETLECLPRTAFGEVTSQAFVYNGTAYAAENFYNTDHSAIAGLDGQVNKNTATGGIAITGLTNAYNNFSELKDEKGKIIVVRPKIVVVHTSKELTLANILMTEQEVGTANNTINQFGPRGRVKLASVVSPFLATTPNLAYVGDAARSLLWLWVQKPQTLTMAGTDDDAFKRQIVWKARFNYYGGVGHRDYRYITRVTT